MKRNLAKIAGALTGDVSGITGNKSGIFGNVTGLRGNVDECALTDDDRSKGVDVSDLVALCEGKGKEKP